MNETLFLLATIISAVSSGLNASTPISKSDFEALLRAQKSPQSGGSPLEHRLRASSQQEEELEALFEQAYCHTPESEENDSPVAKLTAAAAIPSSTTQSSQHKTTAENVGTLPRAASSDADIKAIELLRRQAADARQFVRKHKGKALQFSTYTALTPEAYTELALAKSAQKKYDDEQENFADEIIGGKAQKAELRLHIKPQPGHEKTFDYLAIKTFKSSNKPLKELNGMIELLNKTQTTLRAASYVYLAGTTQPIVCLSDKEFSQTLAKPKDNNTLAMTISLTLLDKDIQKKSKLFTSLINIAELPQLLYRSKLAGSNAEHYYVLDLLQRIKGNYSLYNIPKCNALTINIDPPMHQSAQKINAQSKK